MKNIIKTSIAFAFISIVFFACKKNDYIVGGQLSNATTPLTTYDYLKSNRYKLFDTLLLLVDKAGLKDVINQKGITFYAPTDYSINNYLLKRTIAVQNSDPNKQYTIDSLIKYDLGIFTDSLKTYIIPQTVTYKSLTPNARIFNTAKSGTIALISYETTLDPNLGYNPLVNTPPRIEYYNFILRPDLLASGGYTPDKVPDNVGIRVLCQTSGLTTATGQLNVLNNGHILYFKK